MVTGQITTVGHSQNLLAHLSHYDQVLFWVLFSNKIILNHIATSFVAPNIKMEPEDLHEFQLISRLQR